MYAKSIYKKNWLKNHKRVDKICNFKGILNIYNKSEDEILRLLIFVGFKII